MSETGIIVAGTVMSATAVGLLAATLREIQQERISATGYFTAIITVLTLGLLGMTALMSAP